MAKGDGRSGGCESGNERGAEEMSEGYTALCVGTQTMKIAFLLVIVK
jgi:hypothetical protein